jgi:hypothetical protein
LAVRLAGAFALRAAVALALPPFADLRLAAGLAVRLVVVLAPDFAVRLAGLAVRLVAVLALLPVADLTVRLAVALTMDMSSVRALDACVFTDAIPFSAAFLLSYIWLLAIT